MSKSKKIWLVLMMIVSLFSVTSIQNVSAVGRTYKITFRAGAHGTFVVNGDNKIVIEVEAGKAFPDTPDLKVEDGYYQLGWNKELPQFGTLVEGASVYVAKYQVLTNGKEYTVQYVDENDVPVQTAKTMMAPLGNTVNERAKTIDGYTLLSDTEQSIQIKEESNVIKFIYRNDNIGTEYVEKIVTVPGGVGERNPNVAGGNNQGNENENIGNNDTPTGGGNENIEENETPLSKGDGIGMSQTYLYAIGAGVLVLGFILLILLKKKKENKEEAE